MKKNQNFLCGSVMLLALIMFTAASCKKTDFNSSQPVLNSGANSGGVNGGGANGGGGTGGGGNGGGNPAPTPGTVPTALPISDVVTVGTWKIFSYIEKTENDSQKFSGFTFTFLSNRTLIAKNGGTSTTGTWAPAEAIFYYGIPVYGSNPDGFFITLGSTLPLSRLSKNFFVSFKGFSTFTLESINPAEDTHVIFAK